MTPVQIIVSIALIGAAGYWLYCLVMHMAGEVLDGLSADSSLDSD